MSRNRHTFVATLLLTTIAAAADARQYGAWSNPRPVSVNTPAAEGCPIESQDGLTLMIASNRAAPGARGRGQASCFALGVRPACELTDQVPAGLDRGVSSAVHINREIGVGEVQTCVSEPKTSIERRCPRLSVPTARPIDSTFRSPPRCSLA